MTQQTLKTKTRLSPRVDRDIARLAKSKAMAQEFTLEYVIQRLLAGWVNGRIQLDSYATTAPKTRAGNE